jgi:hypothetical protein
VNRPGRGLLRDAMGAFTTFFASRTGALDVNYRRLNVGVLR